MDASEWMARYKNDILKMVQEWEEESFFCHYPPDKVVTHPTSKGRAAILDKLNQGEWLKSLLWDQEFCRADTRSPKWLGVAIAQHLGLDLSEKNNVFLIRDAIKRWYRHGVITTEFYKDENRKPRKFYVLPKAFRR